MTFNAKMAMPDSQQQPWNCYLIIILKILLFFLRWKMLKSDNSCSVNCRETTIKNLNWYIIPNWSNKTLKGITIVNWALPYLFGRSLEITLTAPLKFEWNFTNSRKITRLKFFFLNPFCFPTWLKPRIFKIMIQDASLGPDW